MSRFHDKGITSGDTKPYELLCEVVNAARELLAHIDGEEAEE